MRDDRDTTQSVLTPSTDLSIYCAHRSTNMGQRMDHCTVGKDKFDKQQRIGLSVTSPKRQDLVQMVRIRTEARGDMIVEEKTRQSVHRWLWIVRIRLGCQRAPIRQLSFELLPSKPLDSSHRNLGSGPPKNPQRWCLSELPGGYSFSFCTMQVRRVGVYQHLRP